MEENRFNTLTREEKRLRLFAEQKRTLDLFLERKAISPAQYEKSLGDLALKMNLTRDGKPITAAAVESGVIEEKSCGAVVWTYAEDGNTRLYLVEEMRQGHYALCKGHVEGTETEAQTALREIREETGLSVRIDTGFRETVEYDPKPGHHKTVVYFTAYSDQHSTVAQEEEVRRAVWQTKNDAENLLTYENDREILRLADQYLEKALLKDVK